MPDVKWLPRAYFGDASRKRPRATPDTSPDDDDEMAETPPDVVEMLGFDPKELADDR
jgi:hypothetical protein